MLQGNPFSVHALPLSGQRAIAARTSQNSARAVFAGLQAREVHCVRVHVFCTRRQPFQMCGIENLLTDVAADKDTIVNEMKLRNNILRLTEIHAHSR